MKRCLFILYAFVAFFSAALAQGYDYDIWLDSRRDAMVHGKFTPGENTLTLDMSVVKTGGLHFLNVIPYYEWGEMGQWSCIPFIVPEGWPYTTNASFLAFLLDDARSVLSKRAICHPTIGRAAVIKSVCWIR